MEKIETMSVDREHTNVPCDDLHFIASQVRTLQEENEAMRGLLSAYRDKRSVDGFKGRVWDGMRHHEAEQDIARMEAALSSKTETAE